MNIRAPLSAIKAWLHKMAGLRIAPVFTDVQVACDAEIKAADHGAYADLIRAHTPKAKSVGQVLDEHQGNKKML